VNFIQVRFHICRCRWYTALHAVQCGAVQCSAVQCSAVQCCAVQGQVELIGVHASCEKCMWRDTFLRLGNLRTWDPHCTALHCIAMHYTALHCCSTALQCITLHCTECIPCTGLSTTQVNRVNTRPRTPTGSRTITPESAHPCRCL
jgi:hypothetical protein